MPSPILLRGRGLLIALIVVASSGSPAFADKFRDFKAAAAKPPSCGLIPYDSLQQRCVSIGERVEKWCKTKRSACKGDDKKSDLKERLANGKQCVAEREDVTQVFAEAKSKLARENGDVKKFAATIIDKIEAGESGHAQVLNDYRGAVANCEKQLKLAK